jgi:phosphate transport system substrate-binding protein
LATLVLLGIVGSCLSFAHAQDDRPGSSLRVEEAGTGRSIFDSLMIGVTDASDAGSRPVVTYTNSIGALRDFCQDTPGKSPDVVLTTLPMRVSLAGTCSKNGINDFAAVELGRGALILAVRSGSALTKLTSQQIYLALARDVPDNDEFRRNTSVRWSDIDHSLPPIDIRFQLPPPEGGGRTMFDSLVLQSGCRQEKLIEEIYSAQHRTNRCITTRIDRVRDIPRDQAVRALLEAPEGTVGVLSYPELVESNGSLVGLTIDGIAPSRENILRAIYGYSTSYWLYAKRNQTRRADAATINAAVDRLVSRAASDALIGPDGLLPNLGLVPLPEDERAEQRAALLAQPSSFDVVAALGWIGEAAEETASGIWTLAGMGSTTQDDADTSQSFDLTALMDIAGYKVKQFDSTFGIIPGAGMTFGIAREMSEADEEFLERALYHDSHRRHGVLAAIQRRLVRAVLDVNEGGDYQVSSVEISFLPLPQVKLIVTPSNGVMSMEATWLMNAIEQLNDRISEIGH